MRRYSIVRLGPWWSARGGPRSKRAHVLNEADKAIRNSSACSFVTCAGDEWNRQTRQFIPKAARLKLPGGFCCGRPVDWCNASIDWDEKRPDRGRRSG